MSRKYFGTDGVRGVANVKLSPEIAYRIGHSAGRYLIERGLPPKVYVGRDTRRSGPMLGAALAAGFCTVGVDVVAVGVVPTPAVSFGAKKGGFGLGVMISASHNPAPDNGIKLISRTGKKLSDEDESHIEALMDQEPLDRPTGAEIGFLNSASRPWVGEYVDFLVGLVPERLDGMKVAVDAAHGAAYELAPIVLERLGATVTLVGAEPDGDNINQGVGATHPATIKRLTLDSGSDVGVSFDGDADRAIFSDELGHLINGDRVIAGWASHWRRDPKVVVGTVMSNTGFVRFMEDQGFQVALTKVGDKYVSDEIERTGAHIGGEQSGHTIFPEHGPTGDGLATAMEMLRVVARMGGKGSAISKLYDAWPQLLVNVEVTSTSGWDQGPRVKAALAHAEEALSGHGRLSARASGTQPLVRIMVEADSYPLRDTIAEEVVGAMLDEVGGRVYSKVDLTDDLGD